MFKEEKQKEVVHLFLTEKQNMKYRTPSHYRHDLNAYIFECIVRLFPGTKFLSNCLSIQVFIKEPYALNCLLHAWLSQGRSPSGALSILKLSLLDGHKIWCIKTITKLLHQMCEMQVGKATADGQKKNSSKQIFASESS